MQFCQSSLLLLAALACASTTQAFVARPLAVTRTTPSIALFAEDEKDAAEAAINVAPDEKSTEGEEDVLAKAESLGRGAAKVGLVSLSIGRR